MHIDGKNDGFFLRTMNCGCYGCVTVFVIIAVVLIMGYIVGSCAE